MQRLWSSASWPPAEALAGGGQLVHATDLGAPPSRVPVVVTVHDLVALAEPELHPRRSVRDQGQQLAGAKRASAVIADSRATAGDLVRAGVDPERIEVVHPGVTDLGRPVAVPGLEPPFVLAVGALHPRKGLDVLVEAFAANAGVLHRLVLAGPDAGYGRELRARMAAMGQHSRLALLGPVTDGELAWLYREATALAFPSRAEGFGLPLVEAAAAGLPVVASDLPVLREVAGDAAVFVVAGDAAALGQALVAVATDEPLRSALADAGPKRAATFTWEATSQRTLACYERVLACA
jgi:glycosyltransferase involved in cell wall biosynthesis